MVGGCGVIGGGSHAIDEMAASLAWTGDEQVSSYEDAALSIRGYRHRHRAGENPGVSGERDVLVWVWGNVVGYRRDGEYRPRPTAEPVPEFCARRYDEDGLEFVERLNGDFAGVVYDREAATVSVFTDRLGTWPIHYIEADDGSVVFSSHVQSLGAYPGVTLSFDEAYVVEHLTWRGGPLGVKTPLQGVETYQPGTVTTYDLWEMSVREDTYWRPTFSEPREWDDFSTFVDAFVERFQASVADRTRDRSKSYGILLSGGSDARLVLGALPDDLDVTAYHMGDWMSKEARIAERIAMTAGVEFRFLRRDPEYLGRVLQRSPGMWNYQQLFNQAWAEGFIDEIRAEVDVLFTGHFFDTLFKDSFIPTKFVDLGPLGSRSIPFELPIESVEEYDEELGLRKPAYIDSDVDPSETLRDNVRVTDAGVEAYGVTFDSFRDFVLGRLHVPATTDPLFRQSLRESLELQMPVFDNRLLDLWLAMPVRYNLQRNVVNAAAARVAPDLAEIPHASSGVAVKRGPLAHRLGDLPMNALRRLSPYDAVPADHVSHHPWGNHAALIRAESYVEDAIYGAEELIRSLPFLDWEEVVACYEDHLAGENNAKYLYRLVTFLEAPLTKQIAAANDDATEPDQFASVAER